MVVPGAPAQEERIRQAIQLSLNQQRGPQQAPEQPSPRSSSHEELLAAIAASVEEEELQRYIACAAVHCPNIALSPFSVDRAVCPIDSEG